MRVTAHIRLFGSTPILLFSLNFIVSFHQIMLETESSHPVCQVYTENVMNIFFSH